MIRPSRLGDEPVLQHLWHIAFGDPPDATACFFAELYQPGTATVWEADGTVVSAIYCLDAGTTPMPDNASRRTAYAYALATLPAYRGQGIGAQVTKAAIQASFEAGFDCNLICPAEPGLFPYYNKLGYDTILSISEQKFFRNDVGNVSITKNVMSTDFATYSKLRRPHLPSGATVLPETYLRYVAHTCDSAPGGLYRLEIEGQAVCATVSLQSNQLFVREILPASLAQAGTQALMAHFGMDAALMRAPAAVNTTGTRPFALAAAPSHKPLPVFDGYFPFVLD